MDAAPVAAVASPVKHHPGPYAAPRPHPPSRPQSPSPFAAVAAASQNSGVTRRAPAVPKSRPSSAAARSSRNASPTAAAANGDDGGEVRRVASSSRQRSPSPVPTPAASLSPSPPAAAAEAVAAPSTTQKPTTQHNDDSARTVLYSRRGDDGFAVAATTTPPSAALRFLTRGPLSTPAVPSALRWSEGNLFRSDERDDNAVLSVAAAPPLNESRTVAKRHTPRVTPAWTPSSAALYDNLSATPSPKRKEPVLCSVVVEPVPVESESGSYGTGLRTPSIASSSAVSPISQATHVQRQRQRTHRYASWNTSYTVDQDHDDDRHFHMQAVLSQDNIGTPHNPFPQRSRYSRPLHLLDAHEAAAR